MILEDISLRVTETFDLMSKHILHRNVFGAQLQSLVDRMDEEGSVHRQIADAYYNSFKAYKGRLFILVRRLTMRMDRSAEFERRAFTMSQLVSYRTGLIVFSQ